MRESRIIMGMPVSVEIVDTKEWRGSMQKVFDYFTYIDDTFSTYKEGSEMSRINRGELTPHSYSSDMQEIMRLSGETKDATNGYFDITTPAGTIDPSGLVKGWAIREAAKLLLREGFKRFYIEVGGDIQTAGSNAKQEPWMIGIRNPFNRDEIIKVIDPKGKGIATSGTYIRGSHIYDPHAKKEVTSDIVSLTVIGPDVYEADRFATAAFAMGRNGIYFIEELPGFEGYAIDSKGIATQTSGFETYVYDASN